MSEREGADAVRELLARPGEPWYLDAWTRALTSPIEEVLGRPRGGVEIAAGIFRLGREHFALETRYVEEVRRLRPVHRVPGRTNEVFRGLVNVRGQLVLCACLHTLLGVEAAPEGERAAARVVVAARGEERWAFEVDEVIDLRRFDSRSRRDPQVTIAKAAVHFTNGLLDFGSGAAACLDPDRLFGGLARSLP